MRFVQILLESLLPKLAKPCHPEGNTESQSRLLPKLMICLGFQGRRLHFSSTNRRVGMVVKVGPNRQIECSTTAVSFYHDAVDRVVEMVRGYRKRRASEVDTESATAPRLRRLTNIGTHGISAEVGYTSSGAGALDTGFVLTATSQLHGWMGTVGLHHPSCSRALVCRIAADDYGKTLVPRFRQRCETYLMKYRYNNEVSPRLPTTAGPPSAHFGLGSTSTDGSAGKKAARRENDVTPLGKSPSAAWRRAVTVECCENQVAIRRSRTVRSRFSASHS